MTADGRIIHPRRSRKDKMLGAVEDAARALAQEQPGLVDGEQIAELTGERLGWDVADNEDEARLAVRAYRAASGR